MCILYCITNQDRILSNGFEICHDDKFISISYYKNKGSNQWVQFLTRKSEWKFNY